MFQLLCLGWLGLAAPMAAGGSDLASLVAAHDVDAIRARGPAVMDDLVGLYEAGGPDERARVARTFYALGWPSEKARAALMRDAQTSHAALRLQVQWALGRVSADPEVVDVLLRNMRHDGNMLFRDKAACALAYDQVHLGAAQRIRLYEGLVAALWDDKDDVRRIALLALTISTKSGPRGFVPHLPAEQRRTGIDNWRRWLADYRAQYE